MLTFSELNIYHVRMILRLWAVVLCATIGWVRGHGDWSYVGHLGPEHWDGECHTGPPLKGQCREMDIFFKV
jgi:hypothetical protein